MPNLKRYSPKSSSKCFLLNVLSTWHHAAYFVTRDFVKMLLRQAIKKDLNGSKVFVIAFSHMSFLYKVKADYGGARLALFLYSSQI